MKNFTKTFMAFVSTLCVFAMASTVKADDEASTLEYFLTSTPLLIPNSLELSLSQEVKYNDNIDEDHRGDARDSFIVHTTVDGELTRSNDNLVWGVGAGLGYEHYFNKPRKKGNNRKDFTYHLTPILYGDMGLGNSDKSLMVKLNSSMENVEIDHSKNESTLRMQNGASLVGDFEFTGKSGLTATFDFEDTRYSGSDYRDIETDKYSFLVAPYYRVSERNRLGINGSWMRAKYRTNRKHDDYDEWAFQVYDNYALTALASLYTSIGVKRKFYEGGSISKHNTGSSGWDVVGLASLRYIITSALTTTLRIGRDSFDSFSGDARGKRIDNYAAIALDWRLTGKVTFRQAFVFTNMDEKTCRTDMNKCTYRARVEYEAKENLFFYAGYNLTAKDFHHMSTRDFWANEYLVGASYRFK